MTLHEPTFGEILQVVEKLRAKDRSEVYATHYHFEKDEAELFLTHQSLESAVQRGHGYVVRWNGEPVAVIGMTMCWPGVAGVWMFATDDFPRVALSLTRWARRALIPLLESAGIHRAQCWSLAGHAEAHQWLRMLGARQECVAPGFGRNGESFHLFAWAKGRDF